ncbi:hypothetical protein [Brassicibacter mesophilus]|uniref:hypothetical protein n=1 Tax=Brassicibacter mesophilus TaxID=745119 RepID=UPI003D1D70DA
MLHPWFKEYILLALRIDKLFKKSGDHFIDAYIGPDELSEIVVKENYKSIGNLMKSASRLIQALPKQNFENQRYEFLEKQVQAMEMTLRILNKEKISFNKQVEQCLDIELKWVPEEYFKQGIELYKQGLPGKGDIFNRFDNWNKRNIYSFKNRNEKMIIINSVIDEIRKRTKKVVDLPVEEKVILKMISNKKFGAATWYLGNYSSLMQINEDIPLNVFNLLPVISHELYPGHHTEFCMKEMEYSHAIDYTEHQIAILISPRLVISEGIGEIAFDIIFEPEDAARWMQENIYKRLDIKTDDVNLACLIKAARTNSLDQIYGNAAILLNDGCSEEQVKKYMKEYTLQSDEVLYRVITNLKESVFKRIYSLSYFNGKNIIKNLLSKQEKQYEYFEQLLIEHVYPSLLIKRHHD